MLTKSTGQALLYGAPLGALAALVLGLARKGRLQMSPRETQ